MDLAADIDGQSVHIIMRCMITYYTSYCKTSPLNVYMAKHEPTRAAAYHRRRYVRVGDYWKHKLTSSYGVI